MIDRAPGPIGPCSIRPRRLSLHLRGAAPLDGRDLHRRGCGTGRPDGDARSHFFLQSVVRHWCLAGTRRPARVQRGSASAAKDLSREAIGSRLRSAGRTGWGLLIVSFSLLAACGPGIGIYDKPGLTYTEWKRDDSECRRDAGENEGGAIDDEAYARCLRARGYKIRLK